MEELSKNMTCRELSQIWLQRNSIGVGFSGSRNLNSQINHINKFFGLKRVIDVTPNDVENMIYTLANENPHTHKPTSKKTLQQLVSTTFNIFDFAVDNDIIYKNPAKNKKKKIPKNATKKIIEAISFQ